MRLIISFFLTLLGLHAAPDTQRIEFYCNIAQGNYLIGDLEGASKGVEQMLKLDPDYVPALTLNTRILLDQAAPDQAFQYVQRAIELEPSNLEHQLLKALVLGSLNRREEAIAIVKSVTQSAPGKSRDHRVASKLLGLFLMAEGNLAAAAEVFNRSYLNNPEASRGNLELAGDAYLQKVNQALDQDDFDAALKAIEQALKLFEDASNDVRFRQHSQLTRIRARILAQTGRVDEAITSLRSIVDQHPENPETLVMLASLYTSTGQWDLLEEILPGIAEQPELQDIALYLEGRRALAKNRVGAARKAFESALRLLPDGKSKLRASLKFYQGVCLLKMDRIEEGDTTITRALDNGFRPENEQEVILAGQSLLRAQHAGRAIVLLEAITLNQLTHSADVWSLLGRAHLANKSTTLALSAFNQSLSLKPRQSETLALRGSLLRRIGDLEGAATDMENALSLDPGNPALIYSLGLTHLQLGKLEDACRFIGISAAKLSDQAGIHLLHALLAYVTEAYEDALSALQTYLTHVPKQTNESAFYLEYTLTARQNPVQAINTLSQRIKTSETSPLLKNFHAYTRGTLDRKAVLDAAGHAETPEIARQQLCEATYWLAQHERAHKNTDTATELLNLTLQIGSTDYPEYQFAQWQLNLSIKSGL